MKKPLRTLFYGQTHEHAPGKLETLKKMRDDYEIVAIVDDFPRRSPMYRDQVWDTADYPIVSEADAWKIPDIDVGFVEVTNCDLMEIATQFAARGIPMHCDKPCGEDFLPDMSLDPAERRAGKASLSSVTMRTRRNAHARAGARSR